MHQDVPLDCTVASLALETGQLWKSILVTACNRITYIDMDIDVDMHRRAWFLLNCIEYID